MLREGRSPEVAPFELENWGWSIVGVAHKEGEDEQIFKLHQSVVV
jgi:hypothetical protein